MLSESMILVYFSFMKIEFGPIYISHLSLKHQAELKDLEFFYSRLLDYLLRRHLMILYDIVLKYGKDMFKQLVKEMEKDNE